MTITLTFTASTTEIVSGVPQSVEISCNVPATIYYTLDETTPTEDSTVYTDAIGLPDNTSTVVLKAFAIDSELNESEVFSQTYTADTTRLDRTRIIGAEGVAVDKYVDERNNEIGYDSDGNVVAYTDEELYKLHPSYSTQGYLGEGTGTAIEVGIADTPNLYDDQFETQCNTESALYFNPLAKVIVLDARKNNEVSILNRPYGSLREVGQDYDGHRRLVFEDGTYISGGFVKTFYSNNVMCSYYWDANTLRYIKSIQALPSNYISAFGGGTFHAIPVFRWVCGTRLSRYSNIPV